MMTRDETIKAIRNALRARSGKTWSVKGGHGTGWGWITISVPPKRLGCARQHALNFATRECTACERYVSNTNGEGCDAHECTERCLRYYITPEERAALLGLDNVHMQGVSIPGGSDYYAEYVARAAGLAPVVVGQRYWD